MSSILHKIPDSNNTNPKGDVLFIHGLAGSAFKTWQSGRDDTSSWPHWLQDDAGDIGVWLLQYAASPTPMAKVLSLFGRNRNAGHSMPLQDRAVQVLDLMVQKNLGTRPLILVCHSLGGLLAKQILRTAFDSRDASEKKIFENIRAVLFLATPHQGAGLASFLFKFPWISTISIEDLRKNGAYLRELYRWYSTHCNKIETVAYFETRKLLGISLIVDQSSANPGVGKAPVGLDENHLSISKPRSKDAQVCSALLELTSVFDAPPITHGRNLMPDRYLHQDDVETKLMGILREQGSIFIKGSPKMGKTYLAKALASSLQDEGFNVSYGSSIDIAESFLGDTVAEARAFLLDDPLGSIETTPNALSIHERLVTLSGGMPKNRLLLVAQRADILEYTISRSSLSWKELSQPPTSFLCAVWENESAQARVPEGISKAVLELLQKQSLNLSVGAVAMLASLHEEIPLDATVEDLMLIANRSASATADALKSENACAATILTTLAMGTMHTEGMLLETLIYVLESSSGETLPGKMPEEMNVSISDIFPKDVPHYELSDQYQVAFDLLEKRQMIDFVEEIIEIRHPFFREAGRSCVENAANFQFQSLMKFFRNCLFSYNPKVSLSIVHNLGQLLRLKIHEPEIIELLLEGLDCFYIDSVLACFRYLSGQQNKLTQVHLEKLMRVSSKTWELQDLEWHQGMPRKLGNGGSEYFESLNRYQSSYIGAVSAKEMADKVESHDCELLPAADLSQVIRYLEEDESRITLRVLDRMMLCPSSPVRSATIHLWIQNNISLESLPKHLKKEFQPMVLSRFFKDVVWRWSELEIQEKTDIEKILLDKLNDPFISIAMLPTLLVFGRREYTGDQTPWDLWVKLFSSAINSVPPFTFFNEARLWSVCNDAVKEVESKAMIDCSMCVVKFLLKQIDYKVPSDYMLGAIELFLKVTLDCPEMREELSERILKTPDTAVKIVAIETYVGFWDELTLNEQELIRSIVVGDGQDNLWVKARVLTMRETQKELVEEITGSSGFLSKTPKDLVDQMQPELLSSCIRFNCADLWPIHSVGAGYCEESTWDPILCEILERPFHPLFEDAFERILFMPDDVKISLIIKKHIALIPDVLFNQLLKKAVICTGHLLPLSWKELLDGTDRQTCEKWLSRVAEVAGASVDRLCELTEWFPDKEIYNEVFEKITGDYCCLAFLASAPKTANPGDLKKTLDKFFKTTPPVIMDTYEYIKIGLRKFEGDFEDTMQELERLRYKAIDNASSIRKEFSSYPVASNWYIQSEKRWTD